MLKRKKRVKINIKNEYDGDYSDIDNCWLSSSNKTGFFEDLSNLPEGCLVIWSMYEDKLYSYDNSLEWLRRNKKK